MRQGWTVRLGQQAEQDYIEILQWTAKTFGKGQAKTYAETVALAIEALDGGPDALSAKTREDIQPGIRTPRVTQIPPVKVTQIPPP
jgi:toxin ParE1/3/4